MDGALTERIMSRRRAIWAGGAGMVAALGGAALARPAGAWQAPPSAPPEADDLARAIIARFSALPGQKALKLWAPVDAGFAEWSATLNAASPLFVASAFKAYVLAEYFRQAEATFEPGGVVPIQRQLEAKLAENWVLDESVFMLVSPVLNPPNLTGKVSARTALEAMIAHSDNTATDMALAQVGANRVREFVASIGLRGTRIPTSLRQWLGYVMGLPDWQTTTWAQVIAESNYPPRPIVNDQITVVSTPDDFVSFYSRALQGEFFRYPETLVPFRAILSQADPIATTMPLGVNAFLKGGNIDVAPAHALCLAGGMYLPKRWVYFGLIVNWTDEEAGPSPDVSSQFIDSARTIFTLVRDRLGV
jgi:beta-lactamase class A